MLSFVKSMKKYGVEDEIPEITAPKVGRPFIDEAASGVTIVELIWNASAESFLLIFPI